MWPFQKKRDFFKLLLDQAEKTEEGLQALVAFTRKASTENARRVEELEQEADEMRRVLIDELNHAFVTPIDREDIFSLSRSVDDMVDYAKSTVEEMIGAYTPCEANDDGAAHDITVAIRLMRTHPQAASEHIIRAKKTENYVEHRYREALVDLFKDPDVVKILKTREIYRHLSNAADRGDESANIIGDIIVKTI